MIVATGLRMAEPNPAEEVQNSGWAKETPRTQSGRVWLDARAMFKNQQQGT